MIKYEITGNEKPTIGINPCLKHQDCRQYDSNIKTPKLGDPGFDYSFSVDKRDEQGNEWRYNVFLGLKSVYNSYTKELKQDMLRYPEKYCQGIMYEKNDKTA